MASFLTPDDIKNIPTGQSVGSVLLNKNLRRIKRPNEKNKVGFQGKTQMELPSATLARQRFGGAVPRVKGEVPLNTPAYKNYIEKPPWERIKIYDVNDQFSTLKEMYRYYDLGNVVHPGLALGVLFSPALNGESIPFLFQGENFRNTLKELSKKYQPESPEYKNRPVSRFGTIKPYEPTLTDDVKDFFNSFNIGIKRFSTGFGQSVGTGIKAAGEFVGSKGLTDIGEFVEGQQKDSLGLTSAEKVEAAQGNINIKLSSAGEPVATDLSKNKIAEMLGAGAASLAFSMGGVAANLPKVVVAAQGLMAGAEHYNRKRQMGGSPATSLALAVPAGVINGLLERWGASTVLKGGLIKGSIAEGLEEISQELSGYSIGKIGGYEDRTTRQFINDAVISGAMGIVLGGIAGGGLKIGQRIQQRGFRNEAVKHYTQEFERVGTNPTKAKELATKFVTDVAPKIQADLMPLVAGAAQQKTSQLAKKTEERAIAEEVIDKPLEGLTEYEVRERDASIASARESRAKNPEKGIKIALAQEQVPKGAGYLAGHMFKAVEKHAKETKDVELIKKLVSSPLAKGASKLGQEVQAYYDPEQDYSLVKIVKDVQESLEERVKTKAWRPGRVEVSKVAKEIGTQLKLFKLPPSEVKVNEVVDKLVKKVETQVKPVKPLTAKKLEQKKVNELVSELFKTAKQTLPAKGKKAPKPALRQVQEMFAKNEKALETYGAAKEIVKRKFAKNPEILNALTEYEKTIPKTPVSKVTVTKAVREELKKNNVKLRNVIKTSIKEQKTTVEDITASLVKKGFSKKSANVFAKIARAELQSQVAKTKASALKQITAAMGRKIPQSTLFEKIEKLNKLGALEDTDYLDLARAKLGVDVSTEELNILVDLTTKLSETRAVIDRTSPDLSESRLEHGRSFRVLQNYVAALKNPRLKMGLLRMAKDVSPAEVAMHPLQTTKGLFGLAKAMKATWDNSFVSRQGRKQMFSEPLIWKNQTIKSFKNIARTLGGQEVLDEFYAGIYSNENNLNGVYKAMGLDIGVFEEEIPVIVHEKLPVIGRVFKAADVAFTIFSQGSRADYADKIYKIAQETETETSQKWFKDAGKLVGAFSSRGKLGRLEPIADTVNVALFSGRKLKSDIDLLIMPFDPKLSPDIRGRAARNLLKYILGVAIILGIARALGAKVETNPTSADSGTFRVGSTRFDQSGGIKNIWVLGARLLTFIASYANENIPYFKSSTTGKMTTRKESNILSATGEQMVIDFLRNKLSPGYGLLSSIGQGKDWRGKPLTLEKEIKNLFVPMVAQVPEEIGTQADSAPVLAAVLAEFFGDSAQTYTSPDNPLIKEDKEWEADMSLKDKSGDFILTNKEKFNARFQWRKEISPYLDKLAKQRNKKAGRGWAEFRKIWNERNADLENDYVSPDSDNFNQEVWDKELNKVLRKHPAFSNQWDNIPQKLILR